MNAKFMNEMNDKSFPAVSLSDLVFYECTMEKELLEIEMPDICDVFHRYGSS